MSTPLKRSTQTYAFRNIYLLIIEEHPFMAELLSSMMKSFGMGRVSYTCSVTDAKALLEKNVISNQKNDIDFVITDLLPPGNEGLDFLRWMRAHEQECIRYLPVIFSSIYTTRSVVYQGRDAGANEILVKPFTADKIAQRLLHLIDKPRPFVRAPGFSGPDRRRKSETFKGTERRLRKDIKVTHER